MAPSVVIHVLYLLLNLVGYLLHGEFGCLPGGCYRDVACNHVYLSHDGIRVLNFCSACQRRKLDADAILPGVIGVMYTTWENKYGDLENFAELTRVEKPSP